VQKHLKQDNDVESSMAQLSRLNELRGEKSKTGSGGAGLKNTWKKLISLQDHDIKSQVCSW